MTAKDHYDNFLADLYSWMTGDFEEKVAAFEALLERNGLSPRGEGAAIDLGAGHGIQSVALARNGFRVTAIDFNLRLLKELEENAADLPVEAVEDTILNIERYAHLKPELILCCGDTLTHLESEQEVRQLLSGIAKTLVPDGTVVLTFRDYTTIPAGETIRIVPRKDDTKEFACQLEYAEEHVIVTDTLIGQGSKTHSTYRKLRLAPQTVSACLEESGMRVGVCTVENGMVTLIANK